MERKDIVTSDKSELRLNADTGQVYRNPVISLDIYATAAALAGKPVNANKADGVNLMPFLTGKNAGTPHEQLFWSYRQFGALRRGDWKVLKGRKGWQLFNLATDLGETNDRSVKDSKRFEQMKLDWLNLRKTMPAYP